MFFFFFLSNLGGSDDGEEQELWEETQIGKGVTRQLREQVLKSIKQLVCS